MIKSSDSRETILAKKRFLRLIGDKYQRERTEKIKYIKIIALPPNSHPVTRFM